MSLRSMVLVLSTGLSAACGTTVTTARIPAFPTKDFPTLWGGPTAVQEGHPSVASAGEASAEPTEMALPSPSVVPPTAQSEGAETSLAVPPAPAAAPQTAQVAPVTTQPTANGAAAPAAVPRNGTCRSDVDCVSGAMCQDGRCVIRAKGRQFQITFDLVPLVAGWWSVDGDTGQPDSSGSLSAGTSLGGTLSWAREYSPRRQFGFYLGFVRSPKVDATVDGHPGVVVGAESRLTLVRGGVLLRGYAYAKEHVWFGGAIEGGLVVGHFDQTIGGLDVVPSVALDFPLGKGPSRTLITTSIGINIGLLVERHEASKQTATFINFMLPVIRVGVGFGS